MKVIRLIGSHPTNNSDYAVSLFADQNAPGYVGGIKPCVTISGGISIEEDNVDALIEWLQEWKQEVHPIPPMAPASKAQQMPGVEPTPPASRSIKESDTDFQPVPTTQVVIGIAIINDVQIGYLLEIASKCKKQLVDGNPIAAAMEFAILEINLFEIARSCKESKTND